MALKRAGYGVQKSSFFFLLSSVLGLAFLLLLRLPVGHDKNRLLLGPLAVIERSTLECQASQAGGFVSQVRRKVSDAFAS